MKPIFKRMLSGVLSATMTLSAIPIVSAHAEESTEPYPYTMFAASDTDGAITVNAGNFCVNGNVAITGREPAITDDLHDASQPIEGGYTFTKKHGYLKNASTFRNEKAYNLMAGGVLVFSMITDMVYGSLSRKDIYLDFSKTKDNSARKVVITVCSSDVQQMYDNYSGFEHSGFIEKSGYPYSQVSFSNACKYLYEEMTNIKADDSYWYDMIVSVDERHKGSSAFANLWINDEGNIMATPILYDNDYVKIVRRSTWTYLFDYNVLLNVPLSETINIEHSYLDLFKKAYAEN